VTKELLETIFNSYKNYGICNRHALLGKREAKLYLRVTKLIPE